MVNDNYIDNNRPFKHKDVPCLRLLEKVAQAKAENWFGNRHFWLILILVIAGIFIYYIENTSLVALLPFNISLLTSVHDLQRTLFFIPATYAAIVYRVRGAIAVSLIFLAVVIPRALLLSPYPDPLFRAVLFCIVAFLVSSLVATQLNYSEHHIKTAGDINRLTSEVKKLGEERNTLLRFLGMAVHDMKAPLAAVQGYLEIMLTGISGNLNDKQKHMLERSSKRIDELIDLISDILDIPRIESGRIIKDMGWFDLGCEIRLCLRDFHEIAEKKRVELRAEIPQKLDKIYGSAPYIKRAVMNLVDNAISYAPGGIVNVNLKENNGYVLVEVIDNGIGIPQDELPKIFSEFFRGSNTDNKGTGLGLPIAKRVVEAHGGGNIGRKSL